MESVTSATALAVRATGLTKVFGDFTAVDHIDLEVSRGVFYGFLGPNGAGKSTTIKMLTGLLSPTAGSIELLGIDLATNPIEVKRSIGVVPEDLALFDRLTGPEYLDLVGRMYGLDRATAVSRAGELLGVMGLADEGRKLIADYSHGMKKKVALAAALIHAPRLVFLDEPFEGVDAVAAKTMKGVLTAMIARGATIFLTSHVLDIVERLCSHVAIINRGVIVAEGSIAELRSGTRVGRGPDGSTLTLEEIFVEIVGGTRDTADTSLAWLGE